MRSCALHHTTVWLPTASRGHGMDCTGGSDVWHGATRCPHAMDNIQSVVSNIRPYDQQLQIIWTDWGTLFNQYRSSRLDCDYWWYVYQYFIVVMVYRLMMPSLFNWIIHIRRQCYVCRRSFSSHILCIINYALITFIFKFCSCLLQWLHAADKNNQIKKYENWSEYSYEKNTNTYYS